MSWILSLTMAFAQFTSSDNKKEINYENPPSKCSFDSTASDLFFAESSKNRLFVFISFSTPLETWKDHSHYLEQLKGTFVLRGLPNNSFEELQKKILELRKLGVRAEIVLDPEAFEKYAITAVPAIILSLENSYDQILGNLQIPYALTLFSESGDTQEYALQLLKKVGARNVN